jgi:GH15 family glucan-1,4-alpha-glucosidase
MAWLALDRAANIARRAGIRADVNRWEQAREGIRTLVFNTGFNPTLQSFVGILGGGSLDASLLRLALVDFVPADDPRMISTVQAIRRELGRGDLIYRYLQIDDGLPGGEGAFLACSFWLVSTLALAGRIDEANAMFSRLLSRSNDLGLFSEELDPDSGELLGNFPQGLTHIAVINAALTLRQVETGQAERARDLSSVGGRGQLTT